MWRTGPAKKGSATVPSTMCFWWRAAGTEAMYRPRSDRSTRPLTGLTDRPLPYSAQSVSIVFFTDTWRPDSFYDRIRDNRRLGLHTLALLDIKVCVVIYLVLRMASEGLVGS